MIFWFPPAHDAGILAFTGDGTNPAVMVSAQPRH